MKVRAIFLDRDGVINKYPGDKKYVTRWKEFKFLPRAKKAISLLSRYKYPIFIISNQAGVSKGIFGQDALDTITKNMLRELDKSRAKIDAVYYCIHRSEDNCGCRKPKSGLVMLAAKGKNLDIKNSYFIGDTIPDVQTARAAGCKSVLVLSGKETLTNRKKWEIQPQFIFKDLFEAAKFITNHKLTSPISKQDIIILAGCKMENRYLQKLKKQVLTMFKGEKVKIVLFGSRATNRHRISSDVDIGIIPYLKMNNRKIVLLREKIENSNIPYKVEIVDFSAVSEDFRANALKEVVVWKDYYQ